SLVEHALYAATKRNVVARHQSVVDDHALEREQHRLGQDRQVGANQFIEGLGECQDSVSDGRFFVGGKEHGVLLQFTKDVELAVNEVLPGPHDVKFVLRQVRRVLIDKRLEQVGVLQESITNLESGFR